MKHGFHVKPHGKHACGKRTWDKPPLPSPTGLEHIMAFCTPDSFRSFYLPSAALSIDWLRARLATCGGFRLHSSFDDVDGSGVKVSTSMCMLCLLFLYFSLANKEAFGSISIAFLWLCPLPPSPCWGLWGGRTNLEWWYLVCQCFQARFMALCGLGCRRPHLFFIYSLLLIKMMSQYCCFHFIFFKY